MRILDIDLDFFLHEISHRPKPGERLDEEDFPTWEMEEVEAFLENSCGLTGRLPGVALEHHDELFFWWRDRISEGLLDAPFSVTHVDGHADLGMGNAEYRFWMTELLYHDAEERPYVAEIENHLTEGNFLAFAIACRWVRDLTYVRNKSFGPPTDWYPSQRTGPTDIPLHVMKDLDIDAGAIQLRAVDPEEFHRKLWRATPRAFEPEIPFRYLHWPDFRSDEPFDVICLTRSPNYTPAASDAIYDAIRERFIDEQVWA